MADFGQRSKMTNFDPINHISARHFNPIHPIWTEIGMDIELDTGNMHADEFLFVLKIQDGRQGQKLNLDKLSVQYGYIRSFNESLLWHLDKICQRHTI